MKNHVASHQKDEYAKVEATNSKPNSALFIHE